MYVFLAFLSSNKATFYKHFSYIILMCLRGKSQLLLGWFFFFFCTLFNIAQKWPLFFVLREYIILYNPKSILNGYTLDVQEVLLFNAEKHAAVPCQKTSYGTTA